MLGYAQRRTGPKSRWNLLAPCRNPSICGTAARASLSNHLNRYQRGRSCGIAFRSYDQAPHAISSCEMTGHRSPLQCSGEHERGVAADAQPPPIVLGEASMRRTTTDDVIVLRRHLMRPEYTIDGPSTQDSSSLLHFLGKVLPQS